MSSISTQPLSRPYGRLQPAPSVRPRPGLGRVTSGWQTVARDVEKRGGVRRTLRCRMQLIDTGGQHHPDPKGIPAECLNVSTGGLYGIVPIGYGVAIGQRFTFRLAVGERGPEPGAGQIVSQQGEVVRAELLLGEDGYGDRVGIGVKLFGPRSGHIPMPAMV